MSRAPELEDTGASAADIPERSAASSLIDELLSGVFHTADVVLETPSRQAARELRALYAATSVLLGSPPLTGAATDEASAYRARLAEEVFGPLVEILRELDFGLRLADTVAESQVVADMLADEVVNGDDAPPDDGEEADDAAAEMGLRGFALSLGREWWPDALLGSIESAALQVLVPLARLAAATTFAERLSRARNAAEADARTDEATGEPPPLRDLERWLGTFQAALLELAASLDASRLDTLFAEGERRAREAAAVLDPGRRTWRRAVRQWRHRPLTGFHDKVRRRLPPDRFRAEVGRIDVTLELVRFDAYLRRFPERDLFADAERRTEAAAGHLRAAVHALRELHSDAARTFDDAKVPDIGRLLRSGRATLDTAGRELALLLGSWPERFAEEAGPAVIPARIGRLPERVLAAPLTGAEEEVRVDAKPLSLTPRLWAEDTFDAFLLTRLADATLPHREAVRRAAERLPGARTVIDYNLEAAGEPDGAGVTDRSALCRELVLDGLDRTADLLETEAGRLDAVRLEGRSPALALLGGAIERWLDRADAEASLEGVARDAWTRIRHRATATGGATRRHGARAVTLVRAVARLGSARAARVLRTAREAVGAEPTDVERMDRTVRVIATLDAGAGTLPFVYRRLFSYRALEDPSLLAGRIDPNAWLDQHLSDWLQGSREALVLIGSPGIGLTSLLNVARARWADRVDWRTIRLARRYEDEPAWAAHLAAELGVEEPLGSLAELESALVGTAADRPPIACAIDNMEHLYLRGVLDRGLILPTLTFMSATDGCVAWIATLSTGCWEVVRATDPGTSALVRVREVEPIGRRDMRTAIEARHQRSGIPLRFEAPDPLPLGLRRALAKARTEEERERLVRDAFFDRLYELSEGYVALALLYWLRSVRVDDGAETMTITWPGVVDFGAWADLPAEQAYALRAFLEHGSLTIGEYGRLMGASRDASFAVFEGLANKLIIEPTGPARRAGTELRHFHVDSDTRYRVRVVLVRPVERLLISRRLIY